MANLGFIIVGAMLIGVAAAIAVEILRRAACPRCPTCGSRDGITERESDRMFVCMNCGTAWPEEK